MLSFTLPLVGDSFLPFAGALAIAVSRTSPDSVGADDPDGSITDLKHSPTLSAPECIS